MPNALSPPVEASALGSLSDNAASIKNFASGVEDETPHPEKVVTQPSATAIDDRRAKSARRVLWIARLLDDQFEVPGIGRRFGLDSVIGLVPVVGDGVSLAMSGTLILEAYRAGVPKHAVVTMVGRAALDAVIGAVPIVGDAFDFYYKANRANARTAMKHLMPDDDEQ